MSVHHLPPQEEMIRAFTSRDAEYEGIFITAVLTTGIFCRPTCPARKPLPKNVRFFQSVKDALDHGFRPCKRCRPLETEGRAQEWITQLLSDLDQDPLRRWRDQDLRDRGLDPDRVRRWFQKHLGMTFQAYSRSRRLGHALGQMKQGKAMTKTAFDAGFESLSGFREAIERITGVRAGKASDTKVIYLHRLETPLGPMLAGATDLGLVLLEFIDRPMLPTQLERVQKRFPGVFVPTPNSLIDMLSGELKNYFQGTLTEFSVPLDIRGTEFQERTWRALLDVSYGKTASYLDLARTIGDSKAVRAVARANGDNRMAIVIPCHRIIGSDGSLTGYGGGLHRKKFLLELEAGSRTGDLFTDRCLM